MNFPSIINYTNTPGQFIDQKLKCLIENTEIPVIEDILDTLAHHNLKPKLPLRISNIKQSSNFFKAVSECLFSTNHYESWVLNRCLNEARLFHNKHVFFR